MVNTGLDFIRAEQSTTHVIARAKPVAISKICIDSFGSPSRFTSFIRGRIDGESYNDI